VGESDADRLHLDLDDGTAESLAPDRKLIPLGQIVGRKPQDSPLSCKATLSCKAAFRHPDDLKIRVQNASRLYLLAADGAAILAFTWLRGDATAERFVRSFAARPREQMASLAIKCAFEHIEHTCMMMHGGAN
jgi:hypothetical protein